jgi:hypothetical protein
MRAIATLTNPLTTVDGINFTGLSADVFEEMASILNSLYKNTHIAIKQLIDIDYLEQAIKYFMFMQPTHKKCLPTIPGFFIGKREKAGSLHAVSIVLGRHNHADHEHAVVLPDGTDDPVKLINSHFHIASDFLNVIGRACVDEFIKTDKALFAVSEAIKDRGLEHYVENTACK